YCVFDTGTAAEPEFDRRWPADEMRGATIEEISGVVSTREPAPPAKNIVPVPAPVRSERGRAIGVMVDGEARFGFRTPSRKLEFYSATLADFGWPEFAVPTYIQSHVHPSRIDRESSEFVLLSTYRLPTLIHTR